jgi:hypothetical protein
VNPAITKLFHNRDLWIVVGGGAAAVTAVAVLAGRGSKSEPSPWASALDGGQPPVDSGPSGQPANDDRLSMLEAELAYLVSSARPSAEASLSSFSTSAPVSRSAAKASTTTPTLTVGQQYYLDNPGALSRAIAEAAPRNVAALPAAPTVAEPTSSIYSGLTVGQRYYLDHPMTAPAPAPAPSYTDPAIGKPFGDPISRFTEQVPGLAPYVQISADYVPPVASGGTRLQ